MLEDSVKLAMGLSIPVEHPRVILEMCHILAVMMYEHPSLRAVDKGRTLIEEVGRAVLAGNSSLNTTVKFVQIMYDLTVFYLAAGRQIRDCAVRLAEIAESRKAFWDSEHKTTIESINLLRDVRQNCETVTPFFEEAGLTPIRRQPRERRIFIETD